MTIPARGMSSSTTSATASSASNRWPDVDTITGSITSAASPGRASATARTFAAFPSIPVFQARIANSSTTASTWARTASGGSIQVPRTSRVFWAVTAVITVSP